MDNFYRGSEWRRWEMHLHTPGTKKEDCYQGHTIEEKWENFYASINDYIGDASDPLKSICAIAITDYLSIDNYLKVKSDNCLPSCVKLILANVELRMTPISKNSPINIHCIFSPEIDSEINSRFFAKLKFNSNGSEYNALRENLERLGRDTEGDQTLDSNTAYQRGLEQFVISSDSLIDVFKHDPKLKEKVIIAISNNSNDGASGITAHSSYFIGQGSQLDATRQSLYQFSDMIFSSNPSDIKYFLGKGTADNEETVKRKCGSLMPCIHGCDAHSNDKIFSPDSDRFCWIKADPTFEGLKQILYEPQDRVRISSSIPDEKQDYHVIDHIVITNNSDFSTEPIYFNDKLTCVIGGKSTGKSLLLHNIALALDAEQVKNKSQTAHTNVKPITELEVVWRDGISSKNQQRKIVYVPQTYLNRLSDEKEETTEIDTIIQDIVLQDNNCNILYQSLRQNVVSLKQKIAKTLVDFLTTFSDKNEILNAQKEIGDKAGIEETIMKLSSALEKMSVIYNVTEEEVKQYQSAVESIQKIELEIQAIQSEQKIINEIDFVVDRYNFNNLNITIFLDEFDKAIESSKEIANKHWVEEKNQILKLIEIKLDSLQNCLKEQNVIEQTLKPKMEGNEQISKLSSDIIKEKRKLVKLEELNVKLNGIQNLYDSQIDVLSHSFADFEEYYNQYAKEISNNFTSSTEDLIFSVNKVFRKEQFSQKIHNILNNKSFGRFDKIDLRDIKETELTIDNLRALIESLLINSIDSLQFKSNYTLESGFREFFTDWYNVDYIVKMDNDTIQEMSPGKKALVLLRLLVSLAESSCPILIDQPEDDLDNRSIFDELIQFIKTKKIDRQIIIVTHNANIVLGGDAELVIVANQQGKNAPNREYKFEYRGGSIENNSAILDERNNTVLPGVLNHKGMQEHICEILEGGERAFYLRKHKYHFIK